MQARHRGGLRLLPLACVIFLVVSGGAYGIEDAVGAAGGRLVLLLCIIVPLTVSLPTALMAAELTALLPMEGGFYLWVKEALGPFAGFIEAYLTLLYTAVDTAIYPVLFSAYLAAFIPLSFASRLAVGLALIWLSGGLNLLGIRPVGRASSWLTVLLLAPLAALVIVGMPRLAHFRLPAPTQHPGGFLAPLGGALIIVIWNFCGWENPSVVAGEIEEPQRNYLRAVLLALPVVVLGCLLPLMVSLSGQADTSAWRAGYFARVGYSLGGPTLGIALGLGGALFAFAVFQAEMMWTARLPFVLAQDGYLPRGLARMWERTATPARAIALCCVVFTLASPLGFRDLVMLDVFFYMGALALEMAALIRLRRRFPHRGGLFTVGGGRPGLYAVALAPVLTWMATFGLDLSRPVIDQFYAALMLSGLALPVYGLCRYCFGGPSRASEAQRDR